MIKTTRIIIAALSGAALLAGASTAFAQSTVTGTLNSGSGTTGSGSSLNGTVTGGSSTSGGTTGTTGGSGSGSNVVDVCPNLSGTQSTLPSGYVISGGNCVQNAGGTAGTGTSGSTSTSGTGSVLGTSTGNPNVPNTGAGGDAAATMLVLATSAIAALGGMRLMQKRA